MLQLHLRYPTTCMYKTIGLSTTSSEKEIKLIIAKIKKNPRFIGAILLHNDQTFSRHSEYFSHSNWPGWWGYFVIPDTHVHVQCRVKQSCIGLATTSSLCPVKSEHLLRKEYTFSLSVFLCYSIINLITVSRSLYGITHQTLIRLFPGTVRTMA